MRANSAALLALLLLSGCTPDVLRQHSVSLSGASSDLRYREVIENLAMIYANPSTLPAYSSIYSGAMDVQDGVQIGGITTWVHAIPTQSGFASQTLDIPATRIVKGTLTLDPAIVPEKLRALRVAFQWAVFSEFGDIPDKQLLTRFQFGSPAGYYFGVADELREICSIDWLGKSCRRRDVPRNACYWAHCGKCYVWVCPEGMESFSRFVLVVQRIARFDTSTLWQPSISTKTVKWTANDIDNPRIQNVTVYVDQYGNLALTQAVPAVPPKTRRDNVGQNSDLKAIINSVIKSP